jgi:hypothetical protein
MIVIPHPANIRNKIRYRNKPINRKLRSSYLLLLVTCLILIEQLGAFTHFILDTNPTYLGTDNPGTLHGKSKHVIM